MTTIDNTLAGKICLVTGATNGIGLVTARALAQMGAHVIVAGRSAERGQAALDNIREETDSESLDLLLADLSSQADIRQFARQFHDRYDRLDVLVNNAGAFYSTRQTSADGLEMTFALNHLGYFMLTGLLLGSLRKAAGENGEARIVNVSSNAHAGARLNWAVIEGRKRINGYQAYRLSKLANILFTYELARKLEGSGVTVNTLHPGFVATGFGLNNPGIVGWGARLAQVFALTDIEGAQTSIYLASSPDLRGVTGKYYVRKQPVSSSPVTYNEETARRLWAVSEQLTGVSY
jgi:NAD(P)-dependent dehydrogenase (short-subunit alcohol dehydrogenase family)